LDYVSGSWRRPLDQLGVDAGRGKEQAVFTNNTTDDIVRLKMGEGEVDSPSVNGREVVVEKNHRTQLIELPPIAGVSK